MLRYSFFLLSVGITIVSIPAFGQQTISLQDAVQHAASQYPSVHVSQEQLNAAVASIRLARTAYLPRIDAIAGIDRGTHNNIFGMLLSSQVIAPISGPESSHSDQCRVGRPELNNELRPRRSHGRVFVANSNDNSHRR